MLQAAAQQPQGGGMMFWVMIGAMILIMWLFMWRPESKRRKQMQEFLANLKKGDKVITAGGIHAVVPTTPASRTIINGSIRLVSALTALSTSSS